MKLSGWVALRWIVVAIAWLVVLFLALYAFAGPMTGTSIRAEFVPYRPGVLLVLE